MQGSKLSYGELDKRANQLAHHLIALGVGPEVPVGVMMERSLDMFVALLGVLKAGGAYVPMDPGYPPDRLALMMEDSEVGWLGTHVHCKVRGHQSGARADLWLVPCRRLCSSARRRCTRESTFPRKRAVSWCAS